MSLLAVALLLTGCNPKQAVAEEVLVDAAKDAVKRIMKDPGSTQFRDVKVVQLQTPAGNAPIVCGEVNAKNELGGYTGFERFAWHPNGDLLIRSAFPDDGRQSVEAGVASLCSGKLPPAGNS